MSGLVRVRLLSTITTCWVICSGVKGGRDGNERWLLVLIHLHAKQISEMDKE